MSIYDVPRGRWRTWRYICPTTGQRYRPRAIKAPRPEDRSVWTWCRCCDTERRRKGQAGYDRGRPQPHQYPLIEAAAPRWRRWLRRKTV